MNDNDRTALTVVVCVTLFVVVFIGSLVSSSMYMANLEYKTKMAAIAVADKAVDKGLSLRFDGDIFKGIVIERK